MAKKQFSLNSEPHEAEVGDVTLRFVPEIMGDEYLDTYERLQEKLAEVNLDSENLQAGDISAVRQTNAAVRVFLASLMLPESAAEFARWDVVEGDTVVSSHRSPEEAQEASRQGTRVVDASMRLPDRVVVELMEWVIELYSGGRRPPTSSTGSAAASPRPGTPGKAASRSRGSMSTRGR